MYLILESFYWAAGEFCYPSSAFFIVLVCDLKFSFKKYGVCGVFICFLLQLTSIFLSVTGTPLGFTASRAGPQTASASWTAPASNNPPVSGYEVFIETEFGNRTSGGSTTSSQLSLTLSSLIPGVAYTAFVVAYGGDLPSAHSNTANISAGETCT